MQNPLDKPGTPFHVELLFPNATARSTKDGPKYRVSFEVDQPTFQTFIEGRNDVRLYARMAVIADDETGVAEVQSESGADKKEPKPAYPAKAKGPYAGFAGRLFALGFFSSPGIKALLHKWEKTYSAENEADAVHCAFGVASRAEISPDDWRNALELEFDRSYPIKSVLDIIKAAEEQAAKVVQ